MNIIVWLEFEHTYNDVTHLHISHYATEGPVIYVLKI